jgi:hypothetical protein
MLVLRIMVFMALVFGYRRSVKVVHINISIEFFAQCFRDPGNRTRYNHL